VILNIQAILTTSVHPPPSNAKFPIKIWLFAVPGDAHKSYPSKLSPKIQFSSWSARKLPGYTPMTLAVVCNRWIVCGFHVALLGFCSHSPSFYLRQCSKNTIKHNKTQKRYLKLKINRIIITTDAMTTATQQYDYHILNTVSEIRHDCCEAVCQNWRETSAIKYEQWCLFYYAKNSWTVLH